MARSGRYLTFQISGSYYAIPEAGICEMMPMQPLVPWPGMKQGLLGALVYRGRFVPIFNLLKHLKLKSTGRVRPKRLILVNTPDGGEMGFAVDQVTDFITVHPVEIHHGSIVGHGRVRKIVDLEAAAAQVRVLNITFSSSSRSRE